MCGDFNIHHNEWLVHSNKNDFEGRYCRDFAIAYELTQMIGEPTWVLETKLLDFFLTFCPHKCLEKYLSPLGTPEYSLIRVRSMQT